MSSPRRSAVVAALVLLAGLAFAGCGRAQPGTAAYVGDVRITEKRIDAMIDGLRRAAPDRTPSNIRAEVVRAVVLSELARQTVRTNSIPVAEPRYDQTARSTGLPADSDLVRELAELDAALVALTQRTTPVQPAEKDLRDIYEGLLANEDIPANTRFEDVSEQIRSTASLPGVLGAREVMLAQAEKVGLEVNPRYRPLIAPIGSLGAPLVLADGIGVRDRA